jgi:acetyltransferase
MELFTGVKREDKFGHLLLCGLGGIFIEALKDFSTGLAPVSHDYAMGMIRSLRSLPVLQGLRGKTGTDLDAFADVLVRVSALVDAAPEICEMDINPLLASGRDIVAVDVRIRIGK